MKNNNIILIGFMGSGKTTVGKILAQITGYRFVDTDEAIIAKEKMSIPIIFQNKGEEYFRKSESIELQKVITEKRQVISTGGGIVTIKENIPFLRHGTVIYLKASPEHVYRNVKKDKNRPLLQEEDVYGKICTMLKDREFLYKKAAHYTVCVDYKTPEAICNELLKLVKDSGDIE